MLIIINERHLCPHVSLIELHVASTRVCKQNINYKLVRAVYADSIN